LLSSERISCLQNGAVTALPHVKTSLDRGVWRRCKRHPGIKHAPLASSRLNLAYGTPATTQFSLRAPICCSELFWRRRALLGDLAPRVIVRAQGFGVSSVFHIAAHEKRILWPQGRLAINNAPVSSALPARGKNDGLLAKVLMVQRSGWRWRNRSPRAWALQLAPAWYRLGGPSAGVPARDPCKTIASPCRKCRSGCSSRPIISGSPGIEDHNSLLPPIWVGIAAGTVLECSGELITGAGIPSRLATVTLLWVPSHQALGRHRHRLLHGQG